MIDAHIDTHIYILHTQKLYGPIVWKTDCESQPALGKTYPGTHITLDLDISNNDHKQPYTLIEH